MNQSYADVALTVFKVGDLVTTQSRLKFVTEISTLFKAVTLLSVLLTGTYAQASTKVAFIGDQGVGSGSEAVLALVADEGADLLMIQGDLGYKENTASQWDAHLTNALGRDFPVLTVVGNHENFEWPLYQRLIQQRIDRVSGLSCRGETGVKADCRFGDLQVVQVAPAIYEVDGVPGKDGYPEFIESAFSETDAPWRICAWHKTMGAMQTSYKGDSTGWEVFDECLDAGAMVAMAHAHTYSRTFLLSDFRTQDVVHRSSEMTLEPGRSFAFVSGLGGRDVREQGRSGDWFASIYTANQGATHGALFCDFDRSTASCYFKAINGSVPDEFTLKTRGGLSSSSEPSDDPVSEPESPAETGVIVPGVFSRNDKDEFRWIDRNLAGEWGNVWISEACAAIAGRPTYSGSWSQLIAMAPAVDTVANPCTSGTGSAPPPPASNPDSANDGYVFVRSDKEEYRWIERTTSGELGSVWIDKACADGIGGDQVRGDWQDLMALAPAFDAAQSPCGLSNSDSDQSTSDESAGFVFSRTDKSEYRWIDRDTSGSLGSVWISENCANELGGPTVFGRWSQLLELAPGFDTISSPCS